MIPVGVVIIGRNEGERLGLALRAVQANAPEGAEIVYVDSGSVDGSVALARAHHAEVVQLDTTAPFTAARARNAGFEWLLKRDPSIQFVQFIDGDCELQGGWLETALSFLASHPDAAVACGRRRERHPQGSIYNRLCDMEWDTPIGGAVFCGGDFLIRAKAFTHVGGLNEAVPAGEEPELCVRLRRAGWGIFRIDAEMTVHDAAMSRFGQWSRRTMRGGYAYAMGAAMHGSPPERHWVRESRSILFWGLALPMTSLALLWPTRGLSALFFLAYPLLAWRVFSRMRTRNLSVSDARTYALFCVLGKFPQALGVLRFWTGRSAAGPSPIIEYKSAAAAAQS